jgi:benzoyl-CoA 2,3-dioxygenase component B
MEALAAAIRTSQANARFAPPPAAGPFTAEQWEKRKYEWLPSAFDTEYLLSIMDKPVFEPGKFANYIAPPRRGINQQPIDFEYVRTEQ